MGVGTGGPTWGRVASSVALVLLVLVSTSAAGTTASPEVQAGKPPGGGSWSGEVLVAGTETVDEGETLRLAPGTTVRAADPSARLAVNGTLVAKGTPVRPVVFEVPLRVAGEDARAEVRAAVLRPGSGSALRLGPAASLDLAGSVVSSRDSGVVVEADAGNRTPHRDVVVTRTVFRGRIGGTAGGSGVGLELRVGGHGDGSRGYHGMVEVVGNRFLENDVGILVDGWDFWGLRLEGNHLEANDVGIRVRDGDVTVHASAFEGNDVDTDVGPDSALRLRGDGVVDVDMRVADGASAQAGDVVVREHPPSAASRLAAAVAAGLLLLYGLLEHLLPRGLLARLLYRKEDEELLEHEARQEILETLQEDPGLHLRELGRVVDGYRRAVYHTRVLDEADIIGRREDGGYVRFYPAGNGDEWWPRSTRGKLLELVREEPGIEQARAARELGCSRQLASYHAGRLEDEGEIVREDEGGRKKLFLDGEPDPSRSGSHEPPVETVQSRETEDVDGDQGRDQVAGALIDPDGEGGQGRGREPGEA